MSEKKLSEHLADLLCEMEVAVSLESLIKLVEDISDLEEELDNQAEKHEDGITESEQQLADKVRQLLEENAELTERIQSLQAELGNARSEREKLTSSDRWAVTSDVMNRASAEVCAGILHGRCDVVKYRAVPLAGKGASDDA